MIIVPQMGTATSQSEDVIIQVSDQLCSNSAFDDQVHNANSNMLHGNGLDIVLARNSFSTALHVRFSSRM